MRIVHLLNLQSVKRTYIPYLENHSYKMLYVKLSLLLEICSLYFFISHSCLIYFYISQISLKFRTQNFESLESITKIESVGMGIEVERW